MRRRLLGRTRAAAALFAASTRIPLWLRLPAHGPRARRMERRFMRRVARGFLKAVRLTGEPPAGPGTLYVSNHVSWLDIPALASVLDAAFVAKADVATWPGIGRLARRTSTLFVRRERRSEAGVQVSAMAERLAAGGSLILFPEGTTSDGTAVLPFRSSLFAAAAGTRMQPLAIRYARADGRPLTPMDQAAIGWVGDEPLLPNAIRLAGMALVAEVRLLSARVIAEGQSRRDLALATHAEISGAYVGMGG